MANKGSVRNPVVLSTQTAANSTPLTGNTTANTVVGPFKPQLARDIWLTVTTTGASGNVALVRSTDGGTTKLPITAAGGSWGNYSFNSSTATIVNEVLVNDADVAATYYLNVNVTAGTVTYRISQ